MCGIKIVISLHQNNNIMKFLDTLKNIFLYNNKYRTHSEAVIIACYYNPTHNPYRLKSFNEFYNSIKHLNHRIVECVIGDASPELPQTKFITRVSTSSTLWHKEALLNNIVKTLPVEFKYVFWIDADVIFTNKNWMVDAVAELQPDKNRMVQLFEYCIHLEQDELSPNFDVERNRQMCATKLRHPRMWRSFGANYVTTDYSDDAVYDKHGHVGFAWGARRYILDAMPLYDKALIGGADHIMAHAAVGQIGHSCIMKSFTDDIDAVNKWSETFYKIIHGKLGYVKGDLYHIWHGAVEKRQYLKRIQDFTSTAKEITERDENGLYVTKNDEYVKQYFDHRETTGDTKSTSVEVKEAEIESSRKISDVVYKTDSYKVKHNKPQKRVITTNNNYDRLKEQKRRELELQYPNSDSSFIDSLLVGYFTDSTFMGAAVGGDILGAALGDMLNNNDQVTDQQDQGFEGGFGGGDFSGGGAGGEWQDNTQNDNFS